MFKPQVFIAKGNAPWFSGSGRNWTFWEDATHVLSIDKSIPSQAIVTCKDVTEMGNMFYDCNKLTSIDLSSFDTSNVTSMWGMFYGCYRLATLDLSNFDTSKVTSMTAMFSDCYNLTSLDLSSFDTSKVFSSDMDYMFSNCSSLTSLDLSSFDTSEITNMMNMFDSCFNLTTIKGIIDMKSCEWCSNMFTNCHKLKDVKIKNPPSGFNVLSGLSESQYTIVS